MEVVPGVDVAVTMEPGTENDLIDSRWSMVPEPAIVVVVGVMQRNIPSA